MIRTLQFTHTSYFTSLHVTPNKLTIIISLTHTLSHSAAHFSLTVQGTQHSEDNSLRHTLTTLTHTLLITLTCLHAPVHPLTRPSTHSLSFSLCSQWYCCRYTGLHEEQPPLSSCWEDLVHSGSNGQSNTTPSHTRYLHWFWEKIIMLRWFLFNPFSSQMLVKS